MTEIVVAPDPLQRAAELVAGALVTADRERGAARFAISGGSSAGVVSVVREMLAIDGVWSRLALTWADERCVPFAHGDSNRGAAYRSKCLSAEQPVATELALWLDGDNAERACERVAAAWVDEFGAGLDVALLGLGEDGHVASLFPGHEWRGEVVRHVTSSPKPPAERLTFTPVALATAKATIVFAVGGAKRDAIQRVLAGDPALPVSHLGAVTLVTDITTGEKL